MTERIQKLRRQSLEATPRVSLERARLLTEFYKSGAAERVSGRLAITRQTEPPQGEDSAGSYPGRTGREIPPQDRGRR